MLEGKRVFLIPHTHWDRAWYLSFEEFRAGLPGLFDAIFRFLENPLNPPFFLDGQTVVVDDYLELHPEMEEWVRKAVLSERLLVGPFYIQIDEISAHPEAIVRNLVFGFEKASELGKVTKVGYFPDTWGHVVQLPQLLKSFGIECFIFGRGYKEDLAVTGVEFLWRGRDGSTIPSVFMPKGYINAINLGYEVKWGDVSACVYDEKRALSDLCKECEYLAPLSPSGNILIMNGGDHIRPFPELARVAEKAELDLGLVVDRSGIGEYSRRIAACGSGLQEYEGRLKYGRYSYIVAGTLSSRMYLKQRNNRLSRKAVNLVEPLLVYGALAGGVADFTLLSAFWKLILQNLAHDEIGGCGIDAVHREMMCRYEKADQLLGVFISSVRRPIANGIPCVRDDGRSFIIFNPSNETLRGTVSTTFLLEESYAEVDGFVIADAAGRPMEYQVLASNSFFHMEINNARRWIEKKMVIRLDGLKPFGFQTLTLLPASGEKSESFAKPGPVEFDTGFFRFSVGSKGIVLEDTVNGRFYKNFIRFVDEEDAGDEYTFSPLEKGKRLVFPIPTGDAILVKNGPLYQSCALRFSLAVPRGIDWGRREREEQLSDIPVELTFAARKDSPVLEMEIRIINTAENHRLRVVFDAEAETVMRGAHYCCEQMERENFSDTSSWKEDPVPTEFFKDYVAASNGRSGLQIITHDTGEFEAGTDGTLWFTLLRCVGDLSREDLLTRKGGAGFSFKTPDAQCKGEFFYRFGIAPFRPGTEAHELYRRADAFLSPPVTFPLNDPSGIIPGQILHPDLPDEFEIRMPPRAAVFSDPMTAFEIVSERIVVTCFQPLPGEDGYLIRLVNYSSYRETSVIRFLHALRSAVETTPDGAYSTDGNEGAEVGNERQFVFRPFEIKTVKVLRS